MSRGSPGLSLLGPGNATYGRIVEQPKSPMQLQFGGARTSAAIAAAVVGGGHVYLPAGEYSITGPTDLPSNVLLEGAGRGATILKLANGANGNVLRNVDTVNGNENVTIRNLSIDGNRANQNGSRAKRGITLIRVGRLRIEDVEVYNVDGRGIFVQGNGGVDKTRAVWLTNLHAHGNADEGFYITNGLRSVHYTNCLARNNDTKGFFIDHSEGVSAGITADGNGGVGIHINNVYGWTLDALVATRNSQHGILVQQLVASTGRGWRAQQNGQASGGVAGAGWADIYFDDATAQTYGLTDNVDLADILAGGVSNVGATQLFGAVTEDYGVFFEDGMAAATNVRIALAHPGSALTAPIRLPAAIAPGLALDFPVAAKRKLSDESVTSAGTLQDDDHLQIRVQPNAVYVIEADLIYEADPAGDLKLAWSGPAGATFEWAPNGLVATATSGQLSQTVNRGVLDLASQTTVGGSGAGVLLLARPTGILTTGATGGVLAFRWAQGSANAIPTIVHAGSGLRGTRIA